MAQYDKFLYDDIGNQYDRKNLYLKAIVTLQERLESEQDGLKKEKLKKELEKLLKERRNHPYIQKLELFKEKEAKFKKNLKEKTTNYRKQLDSALSLEVKNLKCELYQADAKYTFYKNYEKTCYDAQLAYQDAAVVKNELGTIIDHLISQKAELEQIKEEKSKITPLETKQAKDHFKSYKITERVTVKQKKMALKIKQKEGLISQKAYDNGVKEIKAQSKALMKLESYAVPSRSCAERIKSKRYEVNKVSKQKLNVVRANQANVRRNVPGETEKKHACHAFYSCLIPGLGQLLNKQYVKAALFALATVFIYLIAIPYALGYGNYQGQGVAGLITLAEGGAKLDKSLIYMIEGIIAIFLVIFAVVIYILNFKDVRTVEKKAIKGIRPRNWFDTKQGIAQDGFPYLVSLPALVVIVFIVIVPITTAILLSFTGMDPKHQSKFGWVGLQNYSMIAKGEGMAGSVFWNILGWTLIWTVVATTLAIVIGFFLAILANNDRVKGKTFFRTVYLLPWAVPAFITIMFFSIMFSPNGALTEIISGLVGKTVVVKNDAFLSRVVLILLQGWLGSAYIFLLSTGVLQGIPGDLYEAAQIDGASAWQKLKRITLPMVLFQTAPLLVGQYTFNFNNYSIIALFNSGGPFDPKVYGNLAGSTDLLISYVVKLTMDNQQQAVGAAITVVISLGLMFFAFLGFKNSKAFREERL